MTYIARRKQTVYQYNFEGRPYLLTYIDKDECPESTYMKSLNHVTKYEIKTLPLQNEKMLMVCILCIAILTL